MSYRDQRYVLHLLGSLRLGGGEKLGRRVTSRAFSISGRQSIISSSCGSSRSIPWGRGGLLAGSGSGGRLGGLALGLRSSSSGQSTEEEEGGGYVQQRPPRYSRNLNFDEETEEEEYGTGST